MPRKDYYWKNREKCIAKTKQWKNENKEKDRENCKKYRERHREQIREAGKKYREEHREEIRRKSDIYRKNNHEAVKEWRKGYYYRHLDKCREHSRIIQQVHRAMSLGVLVKQPCEVCGDEKTEAHHCDYSMPLDVMWLCKKHHAEWHRHNKPKGSPYVV